MKPWVRRALFLLLYSIIFLGIGYVAALLIKSRSDSSLQDILFAEGLIVLLLGAMMSMQSFRSQSVEPWPEFSIQHLCKP